MDYETIIYETLDYGEIARITFNKPDKANAGGGGKEEFADALKRVADDNMVRVLILAAQGRSFGVLGDISKPLSHPPGHGVIPVPHMKPVPLDRMSTDILRKLNVPVIAAVHGYAMSMLLEECDLIIAADDTKMGILPPRNGDGPEHHITWMLGLPRRKAKEMLFTCQLLDAEELYRIGWVNKVVPLEKLDEETLAMARLIANVNPLITRLSKEMVNMMEELLGYRTIDKALEWYHVLGDYVATPFRPEIDEKRWQMGMKWFNAASRLGAFRDLETRESVLEASMKELDRQKGTFNDLERMEEVIKDTIEAVRSAPDWKGPAIR
ncbi:enoyl-CoA hydratase-related protein [Thermodesulfobacteriota bacterium]